MIMLIDFYFIMHRAHWGCRDLKLEDGTPIGMIYGSINTLLSLVSRYNISDLIICYDGGSSRRKIIDSNYKANRMAISNGFYQQYLILRTILSDIGIKQCLLQGEEADDVIATLAVKFSKENNKVMIVSGDHDFFQIINDNIYVLRIGVNDKIYTRDTVIFEIGIEPEKFYDVMVLTGDGTDNIKGIPKVGIKKAVALIKKYGSIDNIIEKLDSDNNLNHIKPYINTIEMNKKLMKLNTDLNIEIIQSCKNLELVRLIFKDYFKFNSFLRRWNDIEFLSNIGSKQKEESNE